MSSTQYTAVEETWRTVPRSEPPQHVPDIPDDTFVHVAWQTAAASRVRTVYRTADSSRAWVVRVVAGDYEELTQFFGENAVERAVEHADPTTE
ncbi:hypothetical protein [Salinibaculum rarum]|uniref:hypothetical protein n=1 Tax=Salinibaculum rarum TaxID=3058903 RepID=UPI00265E5987|nr:hypothetical protein [Salinibaculum sp. KK48]